MIHKYKTILDENEYLTGFYADENGEYEFDGSLLELDFLNAYKIVDNQPWLDEEKKAEIIAEREAEAERQEEMKEKAEAFDILIGEAE